MLSKIFPTVKITRKLTFGKGAELIATSSAGVESRVSMSELAKLDGVTSSVAELNILTGVTATATQINAATLAASNSRTVTTTATITAADHNCVVFLNSATGFVTTLPAPIAGFKCEVISKLANTSGNHTVVTASSANIIIGMQNSVAGDAGDTGTADDTISFVANQSLAGDRVELRSDGTSWFAYATSKVAAGITFTQAS